MAERDASSESGPSSGSADPEADDEKLSEMLERGWRLLDELDRTSEPLNGTAVQERVQRALAALRTASQRVEQLELFSRNEELEEVSTSELRYLLLPALLGALSLKQSSRDRRLDILRSARACFMDYLRRCADYGIASFSMPKSEASEESTAHTAPCGPGQPDLVNMAAHRQAKIERYRQKKELEAELGTLKKAVESGQADEETSRRFYLLQLRRWITLSLEEVESIDQEIPIVKNMAMLKNLPPAQPSRPPMKPFILTKDALQAQVFGAGYPSLPTMTVDQWYSEHQRRGVLPDQGIPRRVPVEEDRDAAEVQEEQKERQAETEDEEALQKARSWDDYKDTHRRGYGNRHNMG